MLCQWPSTCASKKTQFRIPATGGYTAEACIEKGNSKGTRMDPPFFSTKTAIDFWKPYSKFKGPVNICVGKKEGMAHVLK